MSFSARFSGDSKNLREVCDDFHCVTSEALAVKSVEELQKSAAYLAVKYNDDVNGAEILSEVESLKFQCSAIAEDVQSASSIDLLNAIHSSGLQEVYPNNGIALRLFLTLPVTVATCERSFSQRRQSGLKSGGVVNPSKIYRFFQATFRETSIFRGKFHKKLQFFKANFQKFDFFRQIY